MEPNFNLSMESSFALAKFQQQVGTLNLEQAKELLVNIERLRLIERQMFKTMLMKEKEELLRDAGI